LLITRKLYLIGGEDMGSCFSSNVSESGMEKIVKDFQSIEAKQTFS
jgi:hypothetical protein